jgi:hypothetical protein
MGEAVSFRPFPCLLFETTETMTFMFGVRSLNADEGKQRIVVIEW